MKAYFSDSNIKQMTSWELPVPLTSGDGFKAQEYNIAYSVHDSVGKKRNNFQDQTSA